MLLPWKKPQEAPGGPSAPPPDQTTRELRVALQEEKERRDAIERRLDAIETQLLQVGGVVKEFAGDLDHFDQQLQEGLDLARRRENRIRAAIRRAQDGMGEELELTPALEAELAEFHGQHGGELEEEGVQPMPEALDLDRESSVPGVSVRQLLRAQGVDPSTLGGL